jgi:Uma2 family endonuclease
MVGDGLVTADDFLLMRTDTPYDLIDGRLQEIRFSWADESMTAAWIACLIGPFIREHKLGIATSANGGYVLRRDPDTVVAPDLGFVRRARIPAGGDFEHFFPEPPDLAVEVASSRDNAVGVQRRVELYNAVGVPLVWTVYVQPREVEVHAAGSPPRTLYEGDRLEGGDILPGFTLAVSEIFADPLAG